MISFNSHTSEFLGFSLQKICFSCGSKKSKKSGKSTKSAVPVTLADLKKTSKKVPVLICTQENKLFQARLKAKRDYEEEKFMENIYKNPELIDEHNERDRSFESQLHRTLCRDNCLNSSTNSSRSQINLCEI